ncbi:MAG TPA: hypothetical protein VNN99_03050 [Vicinamibacterales bacterium]|nr:hypothetical protein [Vicinamibacterales bacterium]
MTNTAADGNHFTHIFATILPPSVDDAPICGATLDREWSGRGKPECPACNTKRAQIIAARKAAANRQGA